MKIRNVGKRGIVIKGKSLAPNEAMLVPDDTNVIDFLNNGQIRIEGMKIKEYNKEDLEGKKMSDLRKIGEPLGARDTSKSELVEEILKKQGE